MSLQRGVELYNAGRYWEAHEAWEEAWMPDRKGAEGGFFKGLIQVAAANLHYQRGNRRGALNKWRSGADYLRLYGDSHRGLELAELVRAVDLNRQRLAEGPGWPELELPPLRYRPEYGGKRRPAPDSSSPP